MSEIEISEYCRTKGIYSEEVQAWKDTCIQANGGIAKEFSQILLTMCIKELFK